AHVAGQEVRESARTSLKPFRGMRWPLVTAGAVFTITIVALLGYLLMRPVTPPRITRYIQITHDGRQKSQRFVPAPLATDRSRLYFSNIAPSAGVQSSLGQVSVSCGE